MPGRRRSRSRSGKKRHRSPSSSEGSRKGRGKPSKAPPKSSSRAPEKAPEKAAPKAAKKAPAPAAAASESEEEEPEEEAAGGGDEEEEEISLEAKVALLEVENETLKAENRELRKRLVELLQRARQPPPAAAPAAPAAAAERRKREEPEASGGGGRRAERGGEREQQRDRGEPRREQREEEPQRRRREPGSPPRDDPPEEMQGPNAVMLANSQMEVYNEAITNNVPLEKRLPLVKAKLDRFIGHFDEKIQIIELKSGSAIIKDRKVFVARYLCVFRESGAKLKGTCNKRFFYEASGGYKATYVLDYELHESLVTAVQGTPQDGNLGVRDPRTEHLVVLYEEKGGKVTKMWLRPDTDKLGIDPMAGEDIIERHETFKEFEAKIKELKGGNTGPRIFHNYHQVATVG